MLDDWEVRSYMSFIQLDISVTLYDEWENQLLVANEPIEFEKWPVEVEDFGKLIDRLREI